MVGGDNIVAEKGVEKVLPLDWDDGDEVLEIVVGEV